MIYKTLLLSLLLTLSIGAQQPQQAAPEPQTITTEQVKLAAFQTQRALLFEKLHAITEFQQWLETEANIRALTEQLRLQQAEQKQPDKSLPAGK